MQLCETTRVHTSPAKYSRVETQLSPPRPPSLQPANAPTQAPTRPRASSGEVARLWIRWVMPSPPNSRTNAHYPGDRGLHTRRRCGRRAADGAARGCAGAWVAARPGSIAPAPAAAVLELPEASQRPPRAGLLVALVGRGDRHGEGGAGAELALDLDLAAEQTAQAAGDRQP